MSDALSWLLQLLIVGGEMAAGLLLGPSLLGRLAPGLSQALFGPGHLGALSQLGLLLFMFLVGLEVRPGQLRQKGGPALAITLSSLLVPLVAGIAVAAALYPLIGNPDVPRLHMALFMGTALSITAYPVLAHLVPVLPLDHFPVVGYELPEAVAARRVGVYPGLERLGGGVAHFFSDGRSAAFDALILATGYRPALDPVAHALTLDAAGRPRLDRSGRASTNPRLVCVGYTYPTTEGWLQAINRVAASAVDGIVALPTDAPAGLPARAES